MQLSHLELFAGIGGFRKAIDLFSEDNNYQSKCIAYSEFDKFAAQTYEANFQSSKNNNLGDIKQFTLNLKNIENLKRFNLLTAGFPCQPFSSLGKKKGLSDKRGNLFYDIAKIAMIKQPKIVLLENVRNLKNHDSGNTFKTIKEVLTKECGYDLHYDVFNTANFKLPQNRRRLYILGTRRDLKFKNVDFSEEVIKKSFENINYNTSLKKYKDVTKILEKKVDEKYYLSKKIKPTILSNGTKNFYSKSEINQLIARPLTATMVKMHRASQDNYYSDNFISSTSIQRNQLIKEPKDNQKLINERIRKLTPKEALLLQGFDLEFYKNTTKAGVSDHQIYKQAGNAVSINVVYAIINYLKEIKIIN